MSVNTALVTTTAQANARQQLDDYASAVAGHISGDWAQHRQMRIYNQRFVEPVSTHQVTLHCLRLRLTKAGTTYAVKIPAIATSASPVLGAAPIIYLHPASLTVAVGGMASFTVSAGSVSPLSYQWKKNGVAIPGATATAYYITGAQLTDQASYSVAVSNAYGTTSSNSATLTVNPGT